MAVTVRCVTEKVGVSSWESVDVFSSEAEGVWWAVYVVLWVFWLLDTLTVPEEAVGIVLSLLVTLFDMIDVRVAAWEVVSEGDAWEVVTEGVSVWGRDIVSVGDELHVVVWQSLTSVRL